MLEDRYFSNLRSSNNTNNPIMFPTSWHSDYVYTCSVPKIINIESVNLKIDELMKRIEAIERSLMMIAVSVAEILRIVNNNSKSE